MTKSQEYVFLESRVGVVWLVQIQYLDVTGGTSNLRGIAPLTSMEQLLVHESTGYICTSLRWCRNIPLVGPTDGGDEPFLGVPRTSMTQLRSEGLGITHRRFGQRSEEVGRAESGHRWKSIHVEGVGKEDQQ